MDLTMLIIRLLLLLLQKIFTFANGNKTTQIYNHILSNANYLW